MRENINKLGGDLNADNIKCMRCFKFQGAGFDPEYGIKLCANFLRSRGRIEDNLAHGESKIARPAKGFMSSSLAQRWSMHTIIYGSKSTGRTI